MSYIDETFGLQNDVIAMAGGGGTIALALAEAFLAVDSDTGTIEGVIGLREQRGVPETVRLLLVFVAAVRLVGQRGRLDIFIRLLPTRRQLLLVAF